VILALEVLFALLVAADTILTYRVLVSRKGVEKKYWHIFGLNIPTLMGFVIQYPIFAVIITVIGTLLILLLVNEGQCVWMLIPICAAFGYAVVKAWRILHGR
jgi:hypothetical protein